MATGIIKLNCTDDKGIVYKVSKFLYESGVNIIDAQQYKEELDQQFFMWVKFDCDGLLITRSEFTHQLNQLADTLNSSCELSFSDRPKKMAILVSKYDHCLVDLLMRHKYGELPCEIPLIISNHPDLEALAQHHRIPYFYLPVNKSNKIETEEKMLALLRNHQIDLVVMARYMQILTPVLLDAYPSAIINVHHGFLPAFKGAKPYHQAYEKGVKIIGATSHYATEDLDMGPIIEQETERINHSHSVSDLIRIGRDMEILALSKAVKAHLEERVMIYKGRTIIFND